MKPIIDVSFEEYRKGFIPVEVFTISCETCGFPIEFVRFADNTLHPQPHWYCTEPTVSLMTDNPKRLGIVTSD